MQEELIKRAKELLADGTVAPSLARSFHGSLVWTHTGMS